MSRSKSAIILGTRGLTDQIRDKSDATVLPISLFFGAESFILMLETLELCDVRFIQSANKRSRVVWGCGADHFGCP